MNNKTIGITVIALIIGFGAGYLVHPVSVAPQASGQTFAKGGSPYGGMMRGGNAGGEALSGTVVVKDSGSITLSTRDGSSHVILLTPTTRVSKNTPGALTDISVGSTITVFGSSNSDGSISASTIQLRPAPSTP
ncbi:hypothetical protein HKL94_01100 [Candidatus Parcubacteria bacterium]|nr:hypothetical protein [Candidatus Parcubacteria bacterium]